MNHHRCDDYHRPTLPLDVGPLETSYGAWIDDGDRRLTSGERQVRCPCCMLWIWASEYHHFPVPVKYEHRGGGHYMAIAPDDAALPEALTRTQHRALESPFGGTREMSLCEYNPVKHGPAYNPPAPGDCPNEATVIVGAKANWHLCGSCASLDEFKQMKKTPSRRTKAEKDPSC